MEEVKLARVHVPVHVPIIVYRTPYRSNTNTIQETSQETREMTQQEKNIGLVCFIICGLILLFAVIKFCRDVF